MTPKPETTPAPDDWRAVNDELPDWSDNGARVEGK